MYLPLFNNVLIYFQDSDEKLGGDRSSSGAIVVTSVVCVKFCEIFSLLAGDFCSPDITVTVDWAYKEQVTY